jgi:hypothetical protein
MKLNVSLPRLIPRKEVRLANSLPHSNAQRLAGFVLQAASSPSDLPTIDAWAHLVGISQRTLRSLCSTCGVSPKNVRDLARIVRALTRSKEAVWEPSDHLLVSDERTMKNLLFRAGLPTTPAAPPSVDEFLHSQSFVLRSNPFLMELRKLLNAIEHDEL